jgi:hypothetical protein
LFAATRNFVELYGFGSDMAWGKRSRTVVAGDDSKPSQFRYTFVADQRDVAVVVQFMYTEVAGTKDVIGFMNLPGEEAELQGQPVTISPPPESIDLYMYHNLIVMLRAFPITATQAPTPALEQRLNDANREVICQVRAFLVNSLRK